MTAYTAQQRAMRLFLVLLGATYALQPTPPAHRAATASATALHMLPNPFAKRPEELQELEPYEMAPLFGECRRRIAPCIIVGYEESGGIATQAQADVEVAAADVRLRALVKKLFDAGITLPTQRAAYGLARLATWTGGGLMSSSWVREPESFDVTTTDPDAAVAALGAHLLETYDAITPLREALLLDASSDPQRTNRIALRFMRAYVQTGGGETSVRKAVQEFVPSLTKKAAASFCEQSGAPLQALRRAQATAAGAPAWVGDAVGGSVFGQRLNEAAVETFLDKDALIWIATHCETLEEPAAVGVALDYFCERFRSDDEFTCAGRTPKTVQQQMDAFAESTTVFDDDEAFLPNQEDLRPMILESVTIPNREVTVPYDEDGGWYDGHGPYKLGPGTSRGGTPKTVRVEEILSLKRLIMEGNKLDNCLENKRGSQIKYVMRARQRTSSFWSFTIAEPDGSDLKHVLLLEVWHLRRGDIVRQAEGPRPRTLPSPEAWHWMEHWCDREGVDWRAWDVYSRLENIYPVKPL